MTLTVCKSQVFNSAQTLKKGTFALGFEPTLFINYDDAFYFFIHGGYGLKSGIDMAFHLGLGEGDEYIGGDIEFALRKNISLAVGAHSCNGFGLDGTLLFNIPIRSDINFYTGFDTDINFRDTDGDGDDDIFAPLFIPVGMEIVLKQKLVLYFEAEIGINEYHVLGGGLAFYF